ncbi:MAG: hypothetical protein WBG42_00575, partial [Cryomorphaceae bacterium]
MKQLFTLLVAFTSLISLGQCPVGDVEFNSQSDVDIFVSLYPNCTQIDGNLTIDSQSDENPVENLTGLSGLEVISGNLVILSLSQMDEDTGEVIPGSLEGLEGLTSVSELLIGIDALFLNYHIQSLEPLSNLSGSIDRMILSKTTFYEPLPDFSGLVSMGEFAWRNCNGVEATPAFSNLNQLDRFNVVGNDLFGDSLKTVFIPDIESISGPADSEVSFGIIIQSCHSLENILGGEGLSYVDQIILTTNNSLIDLSAFEEVTEVGRLIIGAYTESNFNSFRNLALANEIVLSPNKVFYGSDQFIDEFTIRIGEDADNLFAYGEGLTINGESIGSLNMTSQFEKLGGLRIDTDDIYEISGFASLDSIVTGTENNGNLYINGRGLNTLPNFENLEGIDGDLILYLDNQVTEVSNMAGFEVLEFIGEELYVFVDPENSTFTSLDGLSALVHCKDVTISGASVFEDISELNDLESLEDIKLYDLPMLSSEVSFPNLSSLAEFVSIGVGFENLPQFPNV